MATDFSTLHIFGYGESQLIGSEPNPSGGKPVGFNVKAPNSALTALQPVVDNVYSKKPADSDAGADYHAINIFHNMFADYQPREGEGFRVQYADLDAALIDALATEIKAYVPPVENE